MKSKKEILIILAFNLVLASAFILALANARSDYPEFSAPEGFEPPPVDSKYDKEFTQQEAEMIRRGNLIVAAITAFKSEEGRYPKTLEELAPNYIEKIPKSPFPDYWRWTGLFFGFPKVKFRYDLKNANAGIDIETADPKELRGYFLHCRYNFDEEYYYSSYGNKWEYHYH